MLISLLVSCSLLNAMEYKKSKVEKTEATVSKEIVCYLRSTYRPTYRENKISDDPYFLADLNFNTVTTDTDVYAVLKYTKNVFNIERNLFVENLIKKSCKNSSNLLPPNPLTWKDYEDIENKLQFYLMHCNDSYKNKLFQKWTIAKKTDYNLFIKTIVNIEPSNINRNQKAIKYFQVKNCRGCINGANGITHKNVIESENGSFSDGSARSYELISSQACNNRKLIEDIKKDGYNPGSTKVITKEKIKRGYPISENKTEFAMHMWSWQKSTLDK